VKGNVNAVYAVTVSAILYVFRTFIKQDIPINSGLLRALNIIAPKGSVINAKSPSACAAGNVETSQRIVDVLFGALSKALPNKIPAASYGTMTNICFGGYDPLRKKTFAYYETIAGGMGARPDKDGEDAVHMHMTNTMNTPIEVLENEYPVRVTIYKIRKGSGGRGRFKGGDGIIREFEFLTNTTCSCISDRRMFSPYGLKGAGDGLRGKNILIERKKLRMLPGKFIIKINKGSKLRIETPGGGGFGK
jgi:N-methylhydantoinase B/oxoprolinase/acetone carboxylase alpha subunit